MSSVLWVGDAVGSTGFARCTHAVCDELHARGWNVNVLGINYGGDPHPYPYPIYPAARHGRAREDGFGMKRFPSVVGEVNPDIIVLLNDPWNIPGYIGEKRGAIGVPTVGWIAVDSKNCLGGYMNSLDHAIFWTRFGQREAVLGGYDGPSDIINLGVDTELFTPVPEDEARRFVEVPDRFNFIVGTVARNQPRKRLDLTIRYFSEWTRRNHIEDAFLILHVAPTGDQGWELMQLCRYYNLDGRAMVISPDIGVGIPSDRMPHIYSSFDVHISTTQGEGWGLTALEAAACGVPSIVPDWSAYGEWFPLSGGIKVPCSHVTHTHNMLNQVGGIMDEDLAIEALQYMYDNVANRLAMGDAAMKYANMPRLQWPNVAKRMADCIAGVHAQHTSKAAVA